MKTRKVIEIGFGLCSVALIWQLVFILVNNPSVPSPLSVAAHSLTILPELLYHLWMSFRRIIIALGIAAFLGTMIGIMMAKNKFADALLSPIIYVMMPIPKAALLPIFMILLRDLGDKPKILTMISVMIFQFMISARDAIKEIAPELNLSAQSLKLSKMEMLRYVTIPAILPKFFTALRIGFSISIAILFFAETTGTQYGIGYFIMHRWGIVNYLDMYSGILYLSLFGLFVYELIDFAQSKLCPWLRA